jgi:broad specificity phosphatase PhoE
MASLFRVVLLAASCLALAGSASGQQALIIVRHAEKADQSKDAQLSEAGRTRARALAAMLVRTGATAIYATQYQRTIDTAQPLADALGLPIERVPAADTAALVSQLKSRHARDIVVVVGHSNTVPDILRLYGHVAQPIADDDFGNVFLVVPKPGGPPVVLRLRY